MPYPGPMAVTRLSFLALGAVSLLAVGACGGDDGADSDEPGMIESAESVVAAIEENMTEVPPELTAPVETESGPTTPVLVFGTVPDAPTPAGFVALPTGCDAPGGVDAPSYRSASVAIPEDWTVRAASGGSSRPDADYTFTNGSWDRSLALQLIEEQPGSALPESAVSGGGFEVAGTVTFGGETVEVHRSTAAGEFSEWVAYFPMVVLESESMAAMGSTGRIFGQLQWGTRGTGTVDVSDDDLLAIFESFTTDECIGDFYAQFVLGPEIQIVT
jgi:hypothetical protein